jgi:hypothetical protein
MRKAKVSPYYSEPLLFESDNVQWNTALGLLEALRLAEARTAFLAYRDVNRGHIDISGYLAVLEHIERGLADLPDGKAGAQALGRLAKNLRELIQRLGLEAEPVPAELPRLLFEQAADYLNLKELASDPFPPTEPQPASCTSRPVRRIRPLPPSRPPSPSQGKCKYLRILR